MKRLIWCNHLREEPENTETGVRDNGHRNECPLRNDIISANICKFDISGQTSPLMEGLVGFGVRVPDPLSFP